MSSQNEQSDMTAQSAQKQPVKDRPHRTIYLPEDLNGELETVIDTLIFEAKTDHDVALGKNRHVYPLIVHLGIQRAKEIDAEELLELLDETPELDDGREA